MKLSTEQLQNACSNYYEFFKIMFEAKMGMPLRENWHLKHVCGVLQDVFMMRIPRLIINEPAGYLKTKTVIEYFIPFCFLHYPDSNFIAASSEVTLMADKTDVCKDIMREPVYKMICSVLHTGGFIPDVDKVHDRTGDWRTNAGGSVYCVGSKGSIVGRRAGLAIEDRFSGAFVMDDLYKAEEGMYSKTIRDAVERWLFSTVETRVALPIIPKLLIMHRLNHGDICGVLERGGDGNTWKVVKIPALNENNKSTWEWKYPTPVLLTIKEFQPDVFNSQYQQTPIPAGGGMVQDRFFTRIKGNLGEFKRIVQSWDTAFKGRASNNPSVCETFGEFPGGGYCLIDVFRKRMDTPELEVQFENQLRKHRPDTILIENRGSGQGLIDKFKTKYPGLIIAVGPKSGTKGEDKESRMDRECSQLEAGILSVPGTAPWLADFLLEVTTFPNAKNDDQVDALSQFLKWIKKGFDLIGPSAYIF